MVDFLADTNSDLDPSELECVCVRGLVGSVSGGVVVSHSVGRTDSGVGGEWNTHIKNHQDLNVLVWKYFM